MIGIDRLGEKVHRAGLHRLHGVLDAAERGHDDDRQLRIEVLGHREYAEPVTGRESKIGQHRRRRILSEPSDGLRLIARFDDGVALRFERQPQHRPKRVLVFDEEDGGSGASQRSQPGGTPALRASSSMSAMALVCSAISLVTRASSAGGALALELDLRSLRRVVSIDEVGGQRVQTALKRVREDPAALERGPRVANPRAPVRLILDRLVGLGLVGWRVLLVRRRPWHRLRAQPCPRVPATSGQARSC